MVELLMEVKNSIEGDRCLRGRSRVWCPVRTWRLKMSVEGCHKKKKTNMISLTSAMSMSCPHWYPEGPFPLETKLPSMKIQGLQP